MKLFFDTEFTGLHQKTTLISIGIISEDGRTFYAELTDYDKSQVDEWIKENVIDKLKYSNQQLRDQCAVPFIIEGPYFSGFGTTEEVRKYLTHWLYQFDKIEMWSDCLAYDWVLFCELWRGAFSIPHNIYYIPFDVCALFKEKGIDPDISRERFAFGEAGYDSKREKHNALWDAWVIRECYIKLTDKKNNYGKET